MKKRIKKILPFFVMFLFFFYIIGVTPPVGDRWMEESIHQTYGHSLRLLAGQIRWLQVANGRIFSNLFSAVVDGNNVWFRAFINATMITICTYIIYKLLDVKNEMIKIFVVTLPAMVSFSIYQEVYYYATTLFISTSLIGIFWLYALCKIDLKSIPKQKKALMYVLAVISATWLENLSMALCVGAFLIIVFDFLENKKCDGIYLKLLLSFIGGFAFVLFSSMFAVNGRLKQERTFTLTKIVDNFVNINIEHSLILGVLAVIVMLLIRHNRKQIGKMQYILQMIFLSGVTGMYLLYSLKRVYFIIKTNPLDYEYASQIYAWRRLQYDIIDDFFHYYSHINKIIPFSIYLIFFVLILYLIIRYSVKKKEEIVVLGMSVAGGAISIAGLQDGARIHTLSIYMLIVLMGLFMSEIYGDEIVGIDKIYILKYLWVIFVAFNMFTHFQFITGQKIVADERREIAEAIRKKQIIGEWDMEKYVILPAFVRDENGWELTHEDAKNPEEGDVYYNILKRYYGLDLNTRISYK